MDYETICNCFVAVFEHYNDYAELLNISVDILKDGKELIDKPDLEKETLKTSPINVDLSSLNLNK